MVSIFKAAHIVKDASTVVIAPDVDSRSKILSADAASSLFSSAAGLIPSSAPHPPPPASESLASFYLSKASSDDARAVARMTEIGAGISLENISARWWGFGRAFSGTDGAPVGGYSSVIQAIASEITSGANPSVGTADIKLEEEVVSLKRLKVEDTATPNLVEVKTRSGNVFTAKTVICTIPLGVLKASPPIFVPSLDASFLASVHRTTVGTLEKVILSYDEVWWPQSHSGHYVLLPTIQQKQDPAPSSPAGAAASYQSLADMFSQTTLSVSNLARIAHQSHPALLVYIGSTAGAFLADFSTEEISEALHTYITSRLISSPESSSSAPKPKHSTVTRWLTDPYARGATSSPISLSVIDDEQASPIDFITLSRSTWDGALGFAGEHTDLDGRGSVVGALVSGKREGERVAALLERLAPPPAS